jgi:hypothetical protein
MRYEPFGRVAEVDQPSADLAGLADTQNPAVLVQYNDSGPVRSVSSQTIDGTEASPVTQAHYEYFDGFGNTLQKVDEGGTPSSPDWVVSGVKARYSNGLTENAPVPFFGVDPGTSGFIEYILSLPGHSFTYDGAGRKR